MGYAFESMSPDEILGKPPAAPTSVPAAPPVPASAPKFAFDSMSPDEILGVKRSPEEELAKGAALFEASFGTPTEEAKKKRLSESIHRMTGAYIAPSVMDTKDAERQFRIAEADHASRASPRTSAFLSHAENAKIAMDDAKVLSDIENKVGMVWGPLREGFAEADGQIGLPRAKTLAKSVLAAVGGAMQTTDASAYLFRKLMAPGAASTSEGLAGVLQHMTEPFSGTSESARKLGVINPLRYVSDWAAGAAADADALNKMLLGDQSKTGFWERNALSAAQSVMQSAMSLPAGLAAMPVKAASAVPLALDAFYSALAFALPGGLVQGGQTYTESRRAGASVFASSARGLSDTATETGFEMIPGSTFLKASKGGTENFAKAFLKAQIPEVLTEIPTTLTQNFTEWAVLGRNKGKTWSDFIDEQPAAVLDTIVTTLMAGGGQVALGAVADASQRKQTQDFGTSLIELAARVAESETRRLHAPTFDAFFQDVTDGATVFIDPDKLTEALAESKLDLATVLPTAAAAIANREYVGTGIEIPVSELISGLAGTGFEQAVIEHVRKDPDAMTIAEANKPIDDQMALYQEAVEKALKTGERTAEFNTQIQQIQDDVAADLDSVGTYTPTANKVQAKAIGAFYAVLADKVGVTPLQLRDGWTDAAGVAHKGVRFRSMGAPMQGFNHGQAMLNVGLDVGATDRTQKIDADFVKAEIEKLGVRVLTGRNVPGKYALNGKMVDELTYVPRLSRPLTDAEVLQLAAATGQEAIAQYHKGVGTLHGTPENLATWGKFNPEFFKDQMGGTLLGEQAAFDAQQGGLDQAKKKKATPIKDAAALTEAASITNASKIAATGKFEYIRDLKEQIQNAVRAAAQGADLSTTTPEVRKYLTDLGTQEALAAMQSNANAIGWYDTKTRQALSVVALIHPEILTDPDARFAFIYALAVTSNGQKVVKNFELAERAYSGLKATGTMPDNVGAGGPAGKKVHEALARYNDLVRVFGSPATVEEFMLTEFTAKELAAQGFNAGGENVDTVVLGAAILGPKIGNGFFANLYGVFDRLTMDRWLMRTWGRWTGTLLQDNQAAVADETKVLKALVRAVRADKEANAAMRQVFAMVSQGKRAGEVNKSLLTAKASPWEALVKTGNFAHIADQLCLKSRYPSLRTVMSSSPLLNELRKSGNRLYNKLDGSNEAPGGGNQRNWLRAVFSDILQSVVNSTGQKMEMADLQALLWYPEKRLYDSAKADDELEGYEDDEAPDYANAAATLARGRGVSEDAIAAALANPADRPATVRPVAGGAVARELGDFSSENENADVQEGGALYQQELRRAGAVSGPVVGVHYSQQDRTALSSSAFGQGMKGAERERIAASTDPRLKQRIAFYVNTGAGIKPESGVGSHAHVATLTNLYDADADVLKLWRNNRGDLNASESAVLDAGFDGYLKRDGLGAAVLLGPRSQAVEPVVGTDAPVVPTPQIPAAKAAAIALATNKSLISGRQTAAEWQKDLTRLDPDMAAKVEWEKLDQEKLFYRQDLADTLWQGREQWYFSALENALKAAPVKVFGSGKAVAQWLRANAGKMGVKAAEIEATGITDWLETQDKVTKEQVTAFMAQGGVRIREVMLGEIPIVSDRDIQPGEEFYGYKIGVNENGDYTATNEYGDVVHTSYNREGIADFINDATEKAPKAKYADSDYVLPGGKEHFELVLTIPSITPWGESDTAHYGPESRGRAVVWVRVNTRVDANGKRVLFIEEIQSKRAQVGRKSGFRSPVEYVVFNGMTQAEVARFPTEAEAQARIAGKSALEYRTVQTGTIPSAPFVTDTKAWTALALKRMIVYAVDNGFDSVAWTTGEQQAERYDLSKVVKSVEARKLASGKYSVAADTIDGDPLFTGDVTESELVDTIGKELAEKIVAQEVGKYHEYSGLDLKVGGEGMKGYYDGIVPQVANDVLKKIGGGKVGEVAFSTAEVEQISKNKYRVVVDGEAKTFSSYNNAVEYLNKFGAAAMTQPGFDITPAMREIVSTKGLPLFAGTPKKGSFSPANMDMRLLADADLSTFLHETSHWFLAAYTQLASEPGAPQALVDEVNALLGHLGAGDLSAWNNMTLDQQRPYHEAWAESGEQYFMTGKAPSLALDSVFRTFANWLKRIYGSLKEFVAGHTGGKIHPTTAAFFDRMLATEAEIQQANEARGYVQLFKDAAEGGMTENQWAAYQAMGDEQREDAEAMLRARSLRDMKWLQNARTKIIGAMQKEAAEQRKAVREQVATELAATPLRQAVKWLKKGEMAQADGTELKVTEGYKLSKSGIEEIFPEGALTPRPDLSPLRGMTAKEGLAPDLVAEMFGFRSGEALVRDLLEMKPFKEEVEELTDLRMLQDHSEMIDQSTIERAADEAIHNDARTRMVATELAALAKGIGSPAALMKAAKEYAKQLIETKTSKTLKPWSFAAAETRAGKAALAALRKGDRDEAAQQKRLELLNHVATKMSYETEAEVKKIIARFKKIAGYKDSDSSFKSRDAELVNAVRAILADFGIGTKGKSAREYLAVVQQHNPDLAAVLSDTIDAVAENAKDWRTLKIAEVRDLAEEIEGLWFLAKRSKQIEIDGKIITLQEAQQAIYDRLDELGIPDRVPGEGSAVTAAEKRGILFDRFIGALRRVEAWVGAKDGALTGPFRTYMWNPIRDAADAYRADKARYLKAYRDLLAPIAPTLTRRLIDAPEIGYTFGKDEGGMGKLELLHAILHTGNESNKRKLLLGRNWATKNADGTLDTSNWDAFVRRMHNEGVLTKADYDFAQGVWDLLDSMKPLAQKAHRAVFGKYFAEVTANEFTNQFGTYAGGYVPAMTDPLIVRDQDLSKMREAEEGSMAYAFPTTAKGFTKSRVEYNRPLKLDLRTLSQHIDKVLLFSHMTRPVNDVRRVMSGKSVAQALGRVDPQAYNTLLLPWLNRAAKQVVETQTPGREGLGRFWSVVRARAGMAAMFANVANSVQQITGLSLAAVRVRPGLLMDAMAKFAISPKATAEYVSGKSKFMTTRLENEVSQMSSDINEILLNPSVYENAKEWTRKHAYFMQSGVDSVIGPVVWLGGYNQAIEAGMSELDAVRAGDSAVRETQGSQAPEDIASFETGSAFYRMFTQFAGYFNMNANLLGTEFVKVSRDMGLKKGAGRGLYVLTLGLLAPAIVGELIMQLFKGGPDDDDKDGEYLDDWLASVLGYGLLRYTTAMVPGVGPAINATVNTLNNKPYDDRISTAPAISMIEAAVKAPTDLYKTIVEGGKPSKAIKEVATLISMTVGVPASALAKPVSYLADVSAGRVAPTGPVDAVRGTITGTASPASKQ